MNELQHLLNKVNRVTSKHRHGLKIPKSDLDSLSNAQIDFENSNRKINVGEYSLEIKDNKIWITKLGFDCQKELDLDKYW